MSTPRCRTCTRNYWRFSKGHPPAGYCSLLCYDTRKKKRPKTIQEAPTDIVEAMRWHFQNTHNSTDLTEWFECEVCERFEERMARANSA